MSAQHPRWSMVSPLKEEDMQATEVFPQTRWNRSSLALNPLHEGWPSPPPQT